MLNPRESKIEKMGECLTRLDNIKQWLEIDTLNKESVSQHSFKVAAFSVTLLEEVYGDNHSQEVNDLFRKVVTHAIFHDLDEALVLRDLSHEVKYNSYNGDKIRDALGDYANYAFFKHFFPEKKHGCEISESNLENTLYNAVFCYNEVVKKFVKLCDWLAMGHYVIRELSVGNTNLVNKIDNLVLGLDNAATGLIEVLKKSKVPNINNFNDFPIRDAVDKMKKKLSVLRFKYFNL